MLLGVILMFCLVVLRIFGINRKSAKRRKTWQKSSPFAAAKGHLRRGVVLRRNEGLPRRGDAEGPKRPPLGFATT